MEESAAPGGRDGQGLVAAETPPTRDDDAASGVGRRKDVVDVALVRRGQRVSGGGGAVMLPVVAEDELEPGRWRGEPVEGAQNGLIGAQEAAQEAAPGEVHVDDVGDAVQLRRQLLDRRDYVQDVGQAAAGRFARGAVGVLGEGCRVGIDADVEAGRVSPRPLVWEAAVTGANVEDDPPLPDAEGIPSARLRLDNSGATEDKHGALRKPRVWFRRAMIAGVGQCRRLSAPCCRPRFAVWCRGSCGITGVIERQTRTAGG